MLTLIRIRWKKEYILADQSRAPAAEDQCSVVTTRHESACFGVRDLDLCQSGNINSPTYIPTPNLLFVKWQS